MTDFSFAAMKTAMERSDGAALIGLYAHNAEMTVVDRKNPPTDPMVLRGKQAIGAFWQDVCGRGMTHTVGREVVGANRVAFVEECAYPDGCRVTAAMNLEVHNGRIHRHLTVQAWNEVTEAAS